MGYSRISFDLKPVLVLRKTIFIKILKVYLYGERGELNNNSYSGKKLITDDRHSILSNIVEKTKEKPIITIGCLFRVL